MKRKFEYVTLCALLLIALNVGLTVPLRIAIGLNAIVMLADVIKTIFWRKDDGNTEEEN